MSYILSFPRIENIDRYSPDLHEIAIFPESCGFVNNQWWHKTLKQKFNTPIDALVFAETIIFAVENNQDCPCGECTLDSTSVNLEQHFNVFIVNKDEEEIHLD